MKELEMLGTDQENQKPGDEKAAANDERNCAMLWQVSTGPISKIRLLKEVKKIYAGLLAAESECVSLDKRYLLVAQEQTPPANLQPDQWQAMMQIHQLLISECHDFLLASQHPVADNALRLLAVEISILPRMWSHGIESLLRVMRDGLPQSLEYMLAFIYKSYNMLTVLLETVPVFEDTWIECLGDLARYRWSLHQDCSKEQTEWGRIARSWYQKKAMRSPHIGRLYHRLAILARLDKLEQLALFMKSLTCMDAYENSQSRIMEIFKPGLAMPDSIQGQEHCLDILFIEAHRSLFCGGSAKGAHSALARIRDGTLEGHIAVMGSDFKMPGVFAAVLNLSALFGYGNVKSNISPIQRQSSFTIVETAWSLAFATLSVALQHPSDENVFPLIHVMLMFLWRLVRVQGALALIEKDIPWKPICLFLNAVLESGVAVSATCEGTVHLSEAFHGSDESRILPEDHVMCGYTFFEGCFPDDWFNEQDEPACETPAVNAYRAERVLWVGRQIATVCVYMHPYSLCPSYG